MTSVRPSPKQAAQPLSSTRRTHYFVLGLPPAASFEQLHERYRELAIQHHPDKGGDAEQFKMVALAWGVLKDKDRRRRYDAQLILEGNVCGNCQGKGLQSGFVGKKFSKVVRCVSCDGAGFL